MSTVFIIVPFTCSATARHAVRMRRKMPLKTWPLFLTLALLFTPPAHAGEIGRLFFTPEQRTQLNYSHQRAATTQESGRDGVILSGIVQKHGGKRTAWINGVAQPAGQSDERSPEGMPITLPGQSKPIKIKVGQRVPPELSDSVK